MTTLGLVVTIPIFSQFVAGSCVHGGDKFECIQSLATGIYFLKYDAHRLFRSRSVEGDDRHAIVFKVFQYLALKRPEFLPNTLVLIAAPIVVESILPSIPIENLADRVHQLS